MRQPIRLKVHKPAIKICLMSSFEEQAARLDIKSIVITTVLSAFGFLVALSWRDAIQKTIDRLIPPAEDLFYSYLAALLVTAVVVAATFILIRVQHTTVIPSRKERQDVKRKKKM